MGGGLEVIQQMVGEGQGVVLASDLRGEGVSRSALRHAVRVGRLIELFGGAFALPGAEGDQVRVLAALRVAGTGSALSFSSAASLFRFEGFALKPFHLSIEGRRKVVLPPDFVVHRPRPFSTRIVDGFRVTTLSRTLVDCAAMVHGPALELMLDDASHRFLFVEERLRRELTRVPISAVKGAAEVTRLLALRVGQASESPAELEVWRALRAHHLPPFVLQHTVCEPDGRPVMRVDVAWLEHRVCLHFDSFRWHWRRVTFDRDAVQRSRLAALGWQGLVVTQATLESGQMIDDLRRLLTQRAPQRSLNL